MSSIQFKKTESLDFVSHSTIYYGHNESPLLLFFDINSINLDLYIKEEVLSSLELEAYVDVEAVPSFRWLEGQQPPWEVFGMAS